MERSRDSWRAGDVHGRDATGTAEADGGVLANQDPRVGIRGRLAMSDEKEADWLIARAALGTEINSNGGGPGYAELFLSFHTLGYFASIDISSGCPAMRELRDACIRALREPMEIPLDRE